MSTSAPTTLGSVTFPASVGSTDVPLAVHVATDVTVFDDDITIFDIVTGGDAVDTTTGQVTGLVVKEVVVVVAAVVEIVEITGVALTVVTVDGNNRFNVLASPLAINRSIFLLISWNLPSSQSFCSSLCFLILDSISSIPVTISYRTF